MLKMRIRPNYTFLFHLENYKIVVTTKDKLNVCRITLMTGYKRRLSTECYIPKMKHQKQRD